MMTALERIYRLLIKVYPLSYRRQYEEPMVQHFRDQMRAAVVARRLVRFWLRTLSDLARTAPARYVELWLPWHGAGSSRLSDEALRSIDFARNEASSFGRSEISLEHLLLGILRSDAELQYQLGASTVGELIQRVESMEGTRRRMPTTEDLALSAECKLAIKSAFEKATASVDSRISSRQLLNAIIQQKSSRAARILFDRGVDSSLF